MSSPWVPSASPPSNLHGLTTASGSVAQGPDARGLTGVWRWQEHHPWTADALLAVVAFIFCVAGPFAHDAGHDHGPGVHGGPDVGLDALSVALLAVSAATLVARRSRPLATWAASLVLAAALILHSGEPPTVLALSVIALYTVGAQRSLRTALTVTVVTAAVYAVAVTAVDDVFGDRTVTLLAVLGAGAAVGVAVRSQRLAVAAAEARARQAEVTREEEAQRRVTDERLRIAQELHDVLAHHISVINVQAGVARHLMEANPEAARTALGSVRASSRTVLSEMTTVLGLLRTGEDDVATQPAPGLDSVPALVETMRQAGLHVTAHVSGQPHALGEVADLIAYRVVQEALTNALKHGTGSADLLLDHGDHPPDASSALLIQVRNPLPRDPTSASAPSGGHGLLGMRERVASVGGRLEAGPTSDGTFSVRAQIPRGTA